jgi:hypothetical protein
MSKQKKKVKGHSQEARGKRQGERRKVKEQRDKSK